MKKSLKILIILGIFLVGSAEVFAQSPNANLGVTRDVTVQAKILRKIVTTKTSDVNFGTIQTETSPRMDPKNRTNLTDGHQALGFTFTIGVVQVNASFNEPIRVQFPDTINLHSASNNAKITYVPVISAAYGVHTVASGADSSLFLGDAVYAGPNPAGPDHAVVTEGTGRGQNDNSGGIIYTYPDPADNTTFERTTLFIGGTLNDVGNRSGGFTNATLAGTYTGTLTLNLLYQ